jgi:phenylalanyl-tRNA synthetase beta chain
MKLFEFGTVYNLAIDKNTNDPLPGFHEETRLALLMTGQKEEENWNVTATENDFFELKGHVNALFKRLNISAETLTATPHTSAHLAAGLSFEAEGKVCAIAGIVSRATLKRFDCKQAVLYADLSWDMLVTLAGRNQISFRDLPRFPEVRRDLALLVDSAVTFSQIEKIAYQTEERLLHKVGLFDVYEGDKIGAGKKSYAVSFLLLDEEKTLTDGEIDKVMQKLITAFEKQAGAVIR